MNEKDLALFKMKAIRSKKELIKAVNNYLVRAERSSLPAMDQTVESLELVREFKTRIEESPLPFLEKPYCAYEVLIVDIEISLEIAEYEQIVFDRDGEIEEASASVAPDIICVRAPYINVEEFAKKRNVKSVTVQRWLREGKLHNAEKRESGWHIAATQKRPSPEFADGTFIFEGLEGDLSHIVPVPKGTVFVSFIEDESSSTGYVALYQNENQRTLARPELEKEELARIKKALICTSDVVFQSSLIEAITDKVIFEECELEDMPFILREIEKFVESSALPSETKRLLKMMLLSEGDWELFLSTIRKLELEEALQLHLRMRRSS